MACPSSRLPGLISSSAMNSDLRLADLPAAIHLLPLDPFVLLPETALPITLTAPWARDLLDRARAAGGWVGIVQTRKGDGGRSPEAQPYGVGCLARVLDEGRDEDGLHVRLEGVIRFRILGDLPADRLRPV